VPAAISTGVHYFIISAALLFGTAAAGLDLTKLAIVVGALSVGIGFGLQNVVNNFISGLILLFERPIQVGDHVLVGQLMGRMTRIGIRASTVRTYDGSEVIVPNGDLISQQVVNYTLSDRDRRMEVVVGVAYGTDLEKARSVIEDALNTVSLVISDPPSQVLFRGFGESSLDFRILFWVDDFENGLRAISEVGIAVDQALRQADIVIPFPQRDLHFRSKLPVDLKTRDDG
jgi:small-conductance mechanosensitive channel